MAGDQSGGRRRHPRIRRMPEGALGSSGHGETGWSSVIHYNRLANGVIYLLLIYGESAVDNIDGRVLKHIRDALK
jgi:hypothetical protein